VGLCLGSQLLGRALGGTVSRLEAPEVGWHEVTLTPTGCEDPLHAGIAWTSVQPHWHQDHVSELPAGARLLSSSTRCPTQAWAVGLRTYGFQYHPEIEASAMERWAEQDPDMLRAGGLTLDQLRQQTETHYPTCARLADRLFQSIALLLIPVDRRYQGIVKDLHH
jgi:GMP synthase (glutamine-hydrolysing)